MSLRIGLVGSKFAADFHTDCYRSLGKEAATISGVYSPNQKSRNVFAQRHGIIPCSSLDQLLLISDVIDICSPPYSHEHYVIAAASAGKHVIVENPLSGVETLPLKKSYSTKQWIALIEFDRKLKNQD